LAAIYGNITLPGRIFSVDKQCQLIHGSLSFFCTGVKLNNFMLYNLIVNPYSAFKLFSNDQKMCSTLKCYGGVIPGGPCQAGIGGIGIIGKSYLYIKLKKS
jgi:hypothetical protein